MITDQEVPTQEEREMTPEEIKIRKAEYEKMIDAEIPFLEKQAKYEGLITSIDKARFERILMQHQLANIMTGQQKTAEPPAPTGPRKLHKVE